MCSRGPRTGPLLTWRGCTVAWASLYWPIRRWSPVCENCFRKKAVEFGGVCRPRPQNPCSTLILSPLVIRDRCARACVWGGPRSDPVLLWLSLFLKTPHVGGHLLWRALVCRPRGGEAIARGVKSCSSGQVRSCGVRRGGRGQGSRRRFCFFRDPRPSVTHLPKTSPTPKLKVSRTSQDTDSRT